MQKNKQIKKIFIVGGLLLLAVAVWVFVLKSWGASRYSAGSEDPAVIIAASWVQYIEEDKIDKAKSLTIANPDSVIEPYRKALGEIGKISTREVSQRNFFPAPTGGRIHQVTFSLLLNDKKRHVSERIFVLEDKDKKFKVSGSRFIVPLTTPYNDGESFTPDLSVPDNPVMLSTNWFNNFDAGKLDQCAKFRGIRGAFNNGMFFLQESSVGPDPRMVKWFEDLRKVGLPTKRETVSRMIWRGLPAMPTVDIVKIEMRGEYPSGKRQEILWMFKDSFIPNPTWHIYHVAFSGMTNDKSKKAAPPVNQKKK